jgi:signal transduction histidine kinase
MMDVEAAAWTIDGTGVVTGWTASAQALLGYSAGRVCGRPAPRLIPRSGPLRDVPPGCRAVELRHADGRLIPVELTVDVLDPGPGRLFLATPRPRSPDPGRDRLESLTLFAGCVAHDLRNVLQGLQGQAGLLSEGVRAAALEPSSRADLEACLDAVDEMVRRGTALARQLSAFARHEALAPTWVDVAALLGDEGRLQLPGEGGPSASSLARPPRIHVHAEAGLPPVWMDPVSLERVLWNLLLNARDASPPDGGIEVRLRRHPLRPGWIQLEVEDEGQGIHPEVRDRLFQPYVTTKEPAEGHGLGLSVVQGLLARAGGTIEVGDGARGGALFRIALPGREG